MIALKGKLRKCKSKRKVRNGRPNIRKLSTRPQKQVSRFRSSYPAEGGIKEVLLDSGQSLSRQGLGREHAGMTTCGNGHFIVWSSTEVHPVNDHSRVWRWYSPSLKYSWSLATGYGLYVHHGAQSVPGKGHHGNSIDQNRAGSHIAVDAALDTGVDTG